MKFEWSKKHKYNSYPHVILGESLKAEEWFTGKYTLNVSEASFSKINCNRTPRSATIEVFHKTQNMELKIGWDHEWDRFTVTVRHPYLEAYHSSSWQSRTYDSKTIKGTLERIKTAIDTAMPVIIAKAQKKAEEDLELNQISEKLGGVDLRRDGRRDFVYGRKDSKYALCFETQPKDKDSEEDMFYIQDISGPYTAEELKQIIVIVGGNPRALLEKLGVSE